MRVTRVEVEGLFAIFNHEIKFRVDERITIIHGPNGYGKTIILKMVFSLLSGSYAIFRSVPFTKFELHLDDGSRVVVQKSRSKEQLRKSAEAVSNPAIVLTSYVVDSAGKKHGFVLSNRIPDELRSQVDAALPGHIRQTDEGWYDGHLNRFISDEAILKEYRRHLQARSPALWDRLDHGDGSPLRRIQKQIHVHLIGTERLERDDAESSVWEELYRNGKKRESLIAVEKYAKELAALISDVLSLYARRAAELDRTFPHRLLQEIHKGPAATVGLRERLEAIDAERSVLKGLGILDEGGLPVPPELFDQAAAVLTVYVRDTEEKLAVFKDLAQKISLLTNIVNERFSHKRVRISRDQGFVLESNMGRISPRDLSSGEQHELVLVYELLFKVDKTWLVLIDEPEISLHVGWQEHFLGDLMRIVKLSNVDVVIATHSPVVIGAHWDLTEQLKDSVPVEGHQ